MDKRTWVALVPILLGAALATAMPQEPDNRKQPPPPEGQPQPGPRPPGGPGGPRFDIRFPGGPGGFMGQERKVVQQFDRDKDGRLNREERQAAREFLKKERPAGGGPGGRGGLRLGFSPTSPLLEVLDSNRDGKLTQEELAAGIQRFFTEADKGKKGTLDEAQVAEALNRILPQPPGFPGGPPPGGPAPGGPPPGGPAPGAAPPGGPPPGGFPGGFRMPGPGTFFAGALVRRADGDKDNRVTLRELTAAANALVQEADKDRDGRLDADELAGAFLLVVPPPPGFGPPGGFGGRDREPPKPGRRLDPDDVTPVRNAGLYEPTVLRTLFLEFENEDWEAELADFHGTDVEVPATLTVDGKTYPNVGVHFRGMSSYGTVPAGYKRSLNLSLDFADPKQRLYGYKTLNLLNAHGDASLLSSVLYSHIARQYIPAPKANVVRVVLNGESWGIYANVQQFNKEFIAEHFKDSKGTRWKVRGSPGGGGGLDYLGENPEDYKRRYELKSGDSAKVWKDLITLCRTLNQTPLDRLEEALRPLLDIDGVLWFLALDVALINNDGYWTRGSDYSLFRDSRRKFHVIPHDMNEAFQSPMGPGFGGPGGPGGRRPGEPGRPEGRGPEGRPGPGGPPPGGPGMGPRPGGVDLDPLVGLDDPRKPLRSRLLAVPSLRARYLEHVRTLAEKSLDWQKLGPVVARYRALIEKEVEADTRKLTSYDAFRRATADVADAGGPGGMSLRSFAERRRQYLLTHPEIKK